MNKVFKIGLFIIIVIFLILYVSYQKGFYLDINKQKTILTEEKIQEYENDLKNGVDVSKKEYVVIVNTYDNNYTRSFLAISKKIENSLDTVIKYLFKKIGDTINE